MYFQQGTPVGNMPPQAAVNGMPPQAQAGLIGMMPPQAQAGLGIGAAETPQMVADTGMPVGLPRAYRDGVFGRRRPEEPYGESLRPFMDGVFGPARAVGQNDATANGNGGPTLTMTKPVITDIQRALNLLVGSYVVPQPAGTWDPATEAAYVTYIEENTPGFPDKAELYTVRNGRSFPSARGVFVLMQDAKQEFRKDYGPDEGEEVWRNMYEALVPFVLAYDSAGMTGKVIPPSKANGEPEDTTEASTLAMWAGGAVLLGVAAFALAKRCR